MSTSGECSQNRGHSVNTLLELQNGDTNDFNISYLHYYEDIFDLLRDRIGLYMGFLSLGEIFSFACQDQSRFKQQCTIWFYSSIIHLSSFLSALFSVTRILPYHVF